MPLYTLWSEGTRTEVVLFGLHCVAGDLLIGASSLFLSLLFFANVDWPARGYGRTVVITVLSGVAYTLWSEWYNVNVAGRWAYSEAMPLIPPLQIGLSPLAQWIVVPIAGLWWARR